MNDLFQQSAQSVKSADAEKKPAPAAQFLRSPCDCGRLRGWRFVEHYDVVRCTCGNYFWALQPKRNGPLVAFAYPRIALPR